MLVIYHTWYVQYLVHSLSVEKPDFGDDFLCTPTVPGTVKNRDLTALQPNLSVCADRKIVILYV